MKGHADVSKVTECGELTAINQYFSECVKIGHKESIDEMKHASDVTDRILI